MNILLLGPQGSGKGTQGELLAKKFDLHYFDAGAVLRGLSKKRPELDSYVNKTGALVPDEMMFAIVIGYLEEKKILDNIIFDGYPRSIAQFELIHDYLVGKGKRIDLAILVNISEAESIKRLSARRIEPKSGQIYNLITNPPPVGVDEASLVVREDDKPEVIRRRLGLYHQITGPLIAKLEKEGLLFKVDGERPVEVILDEISGRIGDLGQKDPKKFTL